MNELDAFIFICACLAAIIWFIVVLMDRRNFWFESICDVGIIVGVCGLIAIFVSILTGATVWPGP